MPAEPGFSGDYNDLTNTPSIPSSTNDLLNNSGFITNPNDADSDPTNELQDWNSLPGIPIDIADGDNVDDADSDPTNELQDWNSLPGIPNMLNNIQCGLDTLSTSGGAENVVYSIVFPTAFNNIPIITCTVNIPTPYDDSFNVTIRERYTTGFVVIVNQVDGSLWNFTPTLSWIAIEP